jgi:hypothetical protein
MFTTTSRCSPHISNPKWATFEHPRQAGSTTDHIEYRRCTYSVKMSYSQKPSMASRTQMLWWVCLLLTCMCWFRVETQRLNLQNQINTVFPKLGSWTPSLWFVRNGVRNRRKRKDKDNQELKQNMLIPWFRRSSERFVFRPRGSPDCDSECVKIQFHVQREKPETGLLMVDFRVLDGCTFHTYVYLQNTITIYNWILQNTEFRVFLLFISRE